jgi:fumarate hydratase class I
MFPLGEDTTEYRLLTREHVRVREFEGKEVLMVEPKGLTLLSKQHLRMWPISIDPNTWKNCG